MKRSNRKGFTIVELVIVIAVVAILTAVLIPTFGGIIEKANRSADEQAVAQMNTAIAIEGASEALTLDAALEALEENGITMDDLIPKSSGFGYVWNEEDGKFELVENATNPVAVAVKDADDFIAALDAVKYIRLDSNITINEEAAIDNADLTINLNGKTLAVNSGEKDRPLSLGTGADVTISGGNIVNTFAGGTYGVCENYGTLTLNNVNFTEGAGDGGASFRNRDGGKIYVNGGSYTVTAANGNQLFRNHAGATGCYLEINGATITSGSANSAADHGEYAIVIRAGEAKLTDVNVRGTHGAIAVEGGKVTIDGGEYFESNAAAGQHYGIYVSNAFDAAEVTVSNAGIRGGLYDICVCDSDGEGGEAINDITIKLTIKAGVNLLGNGLNETDLDGNGNVTVIR